MNQMISRETVSCVTIAITNLQYTEDKCEFDVDTKTGIEEFMFEHFNLNASQAFSQVAIIFTELGLYSLLFLQRQSHLKTWQMALRTRIR